MCQPTTCHDRPNGPTQLPARASSCPHAGCLHGWCAGAHATVQPCGSSPPMGTRLLRAPGAKSVPIGLQAWCSQGRKKHRAAAVEVRVAGTRSRWRCGRWAAPEGVPFGHVLRLVRFQLASARPVTSRALAADSHRNGTFAPTSITVSRIWARCMSLVCTSLASSSYT